MKAPTHHFSRVRLEIAVIAFCILAALSLLVVYVADPAIYAHSLALTSSPTVRYPVPVTLSCCDRPAHPWGCAPTEAFGQAEFGAKGGQTA
jgi:hypothetical protein